MQIRKLSIKNFRGIRSLEWRPNVSLCGIIGPGDSGKSTILDAIEAALSSRWLTFSESDFLGCDSSKTILIEATIGELSKSLKSDERFGLQMRGWTAKQEIRDEPEDDDEPVLTVRLSVDATMEPVWELVSERADFPRVLSNRDRALFGVTRLAGDDARHTSWAQGSVLSKLTDDTGQAAEHLAVAYKAARESANLQKIEPLMAAANCAEIEAKALGAYVGGAYHPGLELGRGGFSTSSIALHDDGIPLRLAGLGSRRLATLAIQKSAIAEGAIVLIDEIEHGLEPHRIVGAMCQLKRGQAESAKAARSIGQIFLTTHSDVALGEVSAENVFVLRRDRATKLASMRTPGSSADFDKLMKRAPRALFSRKILLCEGVTEMGILLGLREFWTPARNGIPLEQLGVAIADGNGSQAPGYALALARLGFPVAIFRDSDRDIPPNELIELAGAGVVVLEYNEPMDTETALITASDDTTVEKLLGVARTAKSDIAVQAHLRNVFKNIGPEILASPFDLWSGATGQDGQILRRGVAKAASDKSWFKEKNTGQEIAPIVWEVIQRADGSQLASCLSKVEEWVYA